ncbi:MAG: DUF3037 domain-containing protein [Bacteroidetes bacterium]|nr:MAG: DUF3037 domain-containing protein [Bacteroidota bacterium]
MMHTFEYQILRYMPDRVTGEFVNLGVALASVREQKVSVRFIQKPGRISEVFSGVNTKYLVKVIQAIQADLERVNNQHIDKLPLESFKSTSELTNKFLPKDNSALFFTPVEKTLDINIDAAADYLFSRIVTIQATNEENGVKQDKEVWSKVYKTYFERQGVTSHLKQHTLKTKFSDRPFEHAWKNGVWHYFEPVNFNLSRPESIKSKVHKWIGEIDELTTANEGSKLYLLTKLSENHTELNTYIKDYLSSKSSKQVSVEVVTQANVEELVASIKEKIELHEQAQ